MDISILIEDEIEFEPGITADWLERMIVNTLIAEDAPSNTEMSLVITSQERIHQLNLAYRNKDKPTDVLSFYMRGPDPIAGVMPDFISPPDGILHMGEVLVSYEQAVNQAAEHDHPVKRELAILIIHGVLHLLGYDHEKSAEMRIKMETREQEILKLMGADIL